MKNLECNCFESGVSGHNQRCVFYGKTPREIADMFNQPEITVETFLYVFAMQRFKFSIEDSPSTRSPIFTLEKEHLGQVFRNDYAISRVELKTDRFLLLHAMEYLLRGFWEKFNDPEFDIGNYATGMYVKPS